MLNGESLNITEENLNKLKILFPNIFSEGKIDLEKFKAAFSNDINFNNERYTLNWAGKADAFKTLQIPTTGTLKPMPEQSINFNTTENIFIEGENLEVLKVLQKSYYNKVKCIIIDPPYNTGSDSFIYPDSFKENKADYDKRIGDKDEEGLLMKEGLFRKNSKDSGHYHSNWLSMMYPRLFLAKNLLKEDGVIFVHIDDNEVHNLRLLMNEIFGEENFLGQFIINSTPNARDYGHIGKMHEYCMFYAKDSFLAETYLIDDKEKSFKYQDEIGEFNIHPLYNSNVAFTNLNRPNLYYPFYLNLENKIENDFYEIGLKPFKNSVEIFPSKSVKDNVQFVWRWGKEKASSELNKNIIGYETETGEYRIVQKMRTSEKLIRSLLLEKEFSTRRGTAEVEEVLGQKIFSFPKPINLTKLFLKSGLSKDEYVLDFFAGSGTTAQSVLELNQEDGGNRKFILVQLPEPCDASSEAFKAGYKTIADITQERIRRVIKKLQTTNDEVRTKKERELQFENHGNQTNPSSDNGFKSFKLSPSNFKIWRGNDITEENLVTQLDAFANPVREESTPNNMLYELLLKAGYTLTEKVVTVIPTKEESAQNYYAVKDGELIIALQAINQTMVDAIIASNPKKVIMLDHLFKSNDQLKTNTALQMNDAGIDFKTI